MSHKGHPYSAIGAFLLDNPIRRLIQPPSELIEKLVINPNDAVVDFGCGLGFYTMNLQKKPKGWWRLTFHPRCLRKPETKLRRRELGTFSFCKVRAQTFN